MSTLLGLDWGPCPRGYHPLAPTRPGATSMARDECSIFGAAARCQCAGSVDARGGRGAGQMVARARMLRTLECDHAPRLFFVALPRAFSSAAILR